MLWEKFSSLTATVLGVSKRESSVKGSSTMQWGSLNGKQDRNWGFGHARVYPMIPASRLIIPVQLNFSLGHNVSSKEEVDAVMKQSETAGSVIGKHAQNNTFYGGYAGYYAKRNLLTTRLQWPCLTGS